MKKAAKKSAKRNARAKPRKNAKRSESVIVIPVGGVEALTANVGDPFLPMNFRELVLQARQEDPANVDQAFRDIIWKTTESQIETLITRLGLKPTDPDVYRRAFVALAIALCGVGQVAWTPTRYKTGWTDNKLVMLYWFVRLLCEQEELSERGAIKRIATDKLLQGYFPYRAHRHETKLHLQKRRFEALKKAWNEAKSIEDQILAAGRPQLIDAVIGRQLGQWETMLLRLDVDHVLPVGGEKRSR